MAMKRHLRMVPPFLMEVFVRSKLALSGSVVIITILVIEWITGQSLPKSWHIAAILVAVIGAQFWHGLVQFEKMRPRLEVRPPVEYHIWGVTERGSTGTGYYFEVSNPSVSESLECVRAELVSIDPEPSGMQGILPFPLHIRHLNYCIAETFINPRTSRRFDLATGPTGGDASQRNIIIPGIIGGDRGYQVNGIPIPFPSGRYLIEIVISARHSPPVAIAYELWIDEGQFLRCAEPRTFVVAEP
jgi:hypothetical protein